MTDRDRVNKYLQRIGYEGETPLTFSTLERLQCLHLHSVPYENFDIMRNRPLALDIDGMYEKIVMRGRGGYCFELNGLFAWLLRSIGFKVIDYMARFLRDETGIPMRRHRVLRVSCEGQDYLCDVGVGGVIPRRPLPYVHGVPDKQNGEEYKLEKEPFWGNVLYELKNGEWKKLYAFTEEEQLDIDYIMPSYYCENHPDSFFRQKDMANIFTENGRKSVDNRDIKIFAPGGVTVIHPATEEEYEGLLAEHFGVRLIKSKSHRITNCKTMNI